MLDIIALILVCGIIVAIAVRNTFKPQCIIVSNNHNSTLTTTRLSCTDFAVFSNARFAHAYAHEIEVALLPVLQRMSNVHKIAMKLTCKWMYARLDINSYPRWRRARTCFVSEDYTISQLHSLNIVDGDVVVVEGRQPMYFVNDMIRPVIHVMFDTSLSGYYPIVGENIRYWTDFRNITNIASAGEFTFKTQYGNTKFYNICVEGNTDLHGNKTKWHEMYQQSHGVFVTGNRSTVDPRTQFYVLG